MIKSILSPFIYTKIATLRVPVTDLSESQTGSHHLCSSVEVTSSLPSQQWVQLEGHSLL